MAEQMMIAMQYSFVLPSDYDMTIINRRIAEKGNRTDNFPNLKFKAYLRANKSPKNSHENLYAPFYLWSSAAAMNEFICGRDIGIIGLSQSFGWPTIRTWSVWQAPMSADVSRAVFATREILAIAPHAALDELRKRDSEDAIDDVERRGALASVAAYEPTTWTRVRLRLWGAPQELPNRDGLQAYDVGHMSVPGR
jgi:hypothetical protein